MTFMRPGEKCFIGFSSPIMLSNILPITAEKHNMAFTEHFQFPHRDEEKKRKKEKNITTTDTSSENNSS